MDVQPSAPSPEGAALPAAARSKFPAPLTPCIGRDAELAQLWQQLDDPACRLLTIVGPGGLGKTRLALELGARLVRDGGAAYAPDGIAFVSLATLTQRPGIDELLATAIAEALGYTMGGPDPPAVQLRRFLQQRSQLLMLDNLEHVPDAVPFISTLLLESRSLRVLATSRERLRLRGERVFELRALNYPQQLAAPSVAACAEFSAVQLFLATARTVTPGVELNDETCAPIVRISQLVEGLPLGIELAASWTRALSCGEIAAELERNLGVLDATMQDVPARHRSLRAVFDSSWSLLSPAEQQTLMQLSVLRGSFGREAAAAVAGATLPLLIALVDKSLIRRLPAAGAEGARFTMPEVLRQFAAELLEQSGDNAATSARYAAFFIDVLAQRTAQLRGREQRAALAALAIEVEHLRAAWRWAVERGDHGALRRAADSLFHFYDMRSWFTEGAAMFGTAQQALASRQAEADAGVAWAKLLAREAWFVFHLGRQREAQALMEQSASTMRALAAADELVFPLSYLGVICSYLGEYGRTEELCRESLAISDSLGDDYGRAVAWNILGQAAYDQGSYEQARGWSEQSRAIEQRIGNRWSMAYSLTNLGKVAFVLQDYATARRMFEESLDIRREMGDSRGVAISLNRMGDVAAAQERLAEAATLYRQSLALSRETGNPWGVTASLINLAQLAATLRRDAAAVRIFDAALGLARDTQALPQALAIYAGLARLLHGAGEPAWEAELRRIAASNPARLSAHQPWLDELQAAALKRLGGSAPGADVEQAIDEVEQRARLPVPSESARPGRLEAPAYPAGLTGREVDVLRLVARGLTDKQVAEQLIVSPRTVTSHLTSIYGKLEVNTRAAATRFAVENGLV